MIMSLIHPTPTPTMDALQSRLTQHNERLASTGDEALNTRKRKYENEKIVLYFVRTTSIHYFVYLGVRVLHLYNIHYTFICITIGIRTTSKSPRQRKLWSFYRNTLVHGCL